MPKSNYKQIATALTEHATFEGNSARAYRDAGNIYRVISYRTEIANYDLNTGIGWVDSTKYSVTTSKLQNMVRRAWGVQ